MRLHNARSVISDVVQDHTTIVFVSGEGGEKRLHLVPGCRHDIVDFLVVEGHGSAAFSGFAGNN